MKELEVSYSCFVHSNQPSFQAFHQFCGRYSGKNHPKGSILGYPVGQFQKLSEKVLFRLGFPLITLSFYQIIHLHKK
jgi:hypothetical protein